MKTWNDIIEHLSHWDWMFILTAATFAATVGGGLIALRAYINGREEAWSLSKLSEDTWMLKRNHRKKATLYGHMADNHNSVELLYKNLSGYPLMVFKRHSYITFSIKGIVAGNLTFFYKEHRKGSKVQMRAENYKGSFSEKNQPNDPNVKLWTNPMY